MAQVKKPPLGKVKHMHTYEMWIVSECKCGKKWRHRVYAAVDGTLSIDGRDTPEEIEC